jgi:hypothetical protein
VGTAGWGVGEESGQAQAIVVSDAQLRAGVGAFFTQDQPGSLRPGGQVDQPGQLGDPGTLSGFDLGVRFPGSGFPRMVGRSLGGLGEQIHGGVDLEMTQVGTQREPRSPGGEVSGEASILNHRGHPIPSIILTVKHTRVRMCPVFPSGKLMAV